MRGKATFALDHSVMSLVVFWVCAAVFVIAAYIKAIPMLIVSISAVVIALSSFAVFISMYIYYDYKACKEENAHWIDFVDPDDYNIPS
jgi:uncharacterized membrane protein